MDDSVTCNIDVIDKTKLTFLQIQKCVQDGQGRNVYTIGDLFPTNLSGTAFTCNISGSWYSQIIGFDHNSDLEGMNTIHLQFPCDATGKQYAFVDSQYGSSNDSDGFRMVRDTSSRAGWGSSYIFGGILAFFNAMSSALRDIIKEIYKYRDNAGGNCDSASSVTKIINRVWLLAEFEVFGSRRFANPYEQNYQKQYKFYENGGSKIRYSRYNNIDSACNWWLASPYFYNSSNGQSFCFVYNNISEGTPNAMSGRSSWGISPAFAIA